MIKVLQVIEKMDRGGAETLIMNIYREIDKKAVQFEFLVHDDAPAQYDQEIYNLGGKIHYLPKPNSVGLIKYQRYLTEFFGKHRYFHAVHSHIHHFSGVIMKIAKKNNLPVRIAHSHTSSDLKDSSFIRNMYKTYMTFLIKNNATSLNYCSKIAALSLFGNLDKKSQFMPNPVDLRRFAEIECVDSYSVRKKYDFPLDKKIIGHIGSFTHPKNHNFLIDTLNSLISEERDWHLVLVGDGPLRQEIKNKVKDLGLDDNVTFFGVTNEVPLILKTFDVLVFPSFFEGLPTAIVEAQAAGIPSIISDTITTEVDMDLGLVETVSLLDTLDSWKLRMKTALDKERPAFEEIANKIYLKGFDISQVAKLCERLYQGDTH
jgi:glycosyltransferase EpsF